MTRCQACATITARAEALLDAHPRVARSIGSRSIGVHQVGAALAALAALDALGSPTGAARFAATTTDAALRSLLDHLTAPGVGATWRARFFPFARHDADPESCTTSPWAHLDDDPEVRALLRDGFAALLRARTETPRPTRAPDGGPCVMCGVETVTVLPSRAQGAWHPVTTTRGALGARGHARGSQERRAGHVCSRCGRHVADAGGIVSYGAVVRALVDELDLGVHRSVDDLADLVDGLCGWGALPPGSPSNGTEPWAHMWAGSSREALARELAAVI